MDLKDELTRILRSHPKTENTGATAFNSKNSSTHGVLAGIYARHVGDPTEAMPAHLRLERDEHGRFLPEGE